MEHDRSSRQAATHGHEAIELARRHGGLLRTADLQEAGIPRVVLTRLEARGVLKAPADAPWRHAQVGRVANVMRPCLDALA